MNGRETENRHGENLPPCPSGLMSKAFGLGRTTLLYYEKLGIVAPYRESDQGARRFTSRDVNRLVGATVLRNAGVDLKEASSLLDGEEFQPSLFENLAERQRLLCEYHAAMAEALNELGRLVEMVGQTHIVEVEERLILYDGTERGLVELVNEQAAEFQKPFLDCMPIASIGLDGTWNGGASSRSERWGRTVPKRAAHFVNNIPEGLSTIGGSLCAVHYCLMRKGNEDQAMEDARTKARSLARKQGSDISDDYFIPFSLSIEDGVYMPACFPMMQARQGRKAKWSDPSCREAIMGLATKNGSISVKEAMRACEISRPTALKAVGGLMQDGLLRATTDSPTHAKRRYAPIHPFDQTC